MTRVVAYLRRSRPSGATSEERERDDLREEASITAQRRAVEYASEFHGYQIVGTEQDILSGKDMRRPGLRAALAACDTGEADAIIVATLDRLSRSSLDFEMLMKRASKRGWRILVADGNIDLSAADGRFMARVLMNAAQHEREKTGERTRVALAAKREQGVRLGRPPMVDAELRDRIRELRSAMSLRQVAQTLNNAGVPTVAGGREWYASTVSQVLGGES